NPRARAGRDLGFYGSQLIVSVSIHAPARGATIKTVSRTYRFQFQSTRPRGARHSVFTSRLMLDCFNPRARAGGDGAVVLLLGRDARFNPRARAGRDVT